MLKNKKLREYKKGNKKYNNKNNNKKQEQLGIPFGTATQRLRKMVLFDLLKRHKENICYRCGEEIKTVEELSMEHKEAWLDNSSELFWDLSNIAFSHLSCNIKHSRVSNKIEYPEGKRWCWDCKKFKDSVLFPPSLKNRQVKCTECNRKYMFKYRCKKKLKKTKVNAY